MNNHNLKDGITGFLIYRQGYFLQGEAQITERVMPDWSMGEVTLKPGQTSSDKIIDLLELARNNQIYTSPESLMSLVKIFSRDVVIF